VTIADAFGKTYHSWLRHSLLKYVSFHPSQVGNKKGSGTDTATHVVKVFIEWCSLTTRSGAALFLDVAAALDSVVRQIVVGGRVPEAVLASLPDEQKETVQEAARHFVIGEGVPEGLVARLRDVHEQTWLAIERREKPVSTNRGSRPGDPLGDILWNLVQAKLQKEISAELREAGLHVSLPSNDGIGFTTPPHDDAATTAYVDDVTFMISAPAK
jgi:hypothetical protein